MTTAHHRHPKPRLPLLVGVLAAGLLAAGADPVPAASLRGSQSSILKQNRSARSHDFTYLQTPAHVRRFVDAGILVPVPGNQDYELAQVSFPYARPEVKVFVERLARQYRSATGEKLVVTSLTRPRSHQPRNASESSVHPCGMAIDIRKSHHRSARRWLEEVLLSLERSGVVEATLERRPPHYHVAVFPGPYAAYVARQTGEAFASQYRVRQGDSLWGIARKHNTTVGVLKQANEMASVTIFPGQVLEIPAVR